MSEFANTTDPESIIVVDWETVEYEIKIVDIEDDA